MLLGNRSCRYSLIQVCLKKWAQKLTAATFTIFQTLRSSSQKGSNWKVWQMKIWRICFHYIVFYWCYARIRSLVSYHRWTTLKFGKAILCDVEVISFFPPYFWQTRCASSDLVFVGFFEHPRAVGSQEVYADVCA